MNMLLLQVLLAFLYGALIGLERDYHGSPAGIRTYAIVCLGACVFGLISTHAQGGAFYKSVADPTRIAAQIVSGIGFLGAGVIFRDGLTAKGLTTAATIWASASIGLAIAFMLYKIATLATLLIIFLSALNDLPFWKTFKRKFRRRGSKKSVAQQE
jgi:putative Mg2+ transporter-C (MgtC) family protein